MASEALAKETLMTNDEAHQTVNYQEWQSHGKD